MNLDDLTMVILTHRCPTMLANLLELYSGQGITFSIVVADSSTPEIQQRNAEVIARYDHVRHAQFEPGYDVYAKIHALPDFVTTRFGMYAADDDVVIFSGLLEAVAFLRDQPDYVACHGVYYNAQMSDAETLKVQTEYAVVSHDLPDAFARMLSLCVRYQSVFYTVMRRETLDRTRVPQTIRTDHFYELYNGFRLLLEGKVAGLRSPYIIRNSIQGDVSSRMLDRDPAVWIVKDSAHFFGTGYLPFRAALATALAPHVADGTAEGLVDVAYATFFARMFNVEMAIGSLANAGRISTSAAARIGHARGLPNVSAAPTPEVAGVIRHLAERGWPTYG
jgi:glycosyltransferase domain-containing protein